ncbi:MAG: hypothetical protein LW841_04480, partial [Flammeovirgaceae bacterium]|nr:hypothetical protein [Flammeovirgaceae bacterium]
PLFSSMPHPYCSKSWSPPELSSSSGEAGILSTFNLKSTNHFSVHYQKKTPPFRGHMCARYAQYNTLSCARWKEAICKTSM